MSDIPFWSGGSGGGTGGVSNYDQLSNKPVTNISGSGIVISSLSTGVYNIDGTWKITPDDDERETLRMIFSMLKMTERMSSLHGSAPV